MIGAAERVRATGWRSPPDGDPPVRNSQGTSVRQVTASTRRTDRSAAMGTRHPRLPIGMAVANAPGGVVRPADEKIVGGPGHKPPHQARSVAFGQLTPQWAMVGDGDLHQLRQWSVAFGDHPQFFSSVGVVFRRHSRNGQWSVAFGDLHCQDMCPNATKRVPRGYCPLLIATRRPVGPTQQSRGTPPYTLLTPWTSPFSPRALEWQAG